MSLAYFVRHGESTWNKLGIMQGRRGDPPLTDAGGRQAVELADMLEGLAISRLVSSTSLRARETAEVVGARLRLAVHPTQLLRERDWGAYEGRPRVEGQAADALLDDEDRIAEGESRAEVRQRLRRFVLSGGLGEPTDKVLVITHGDVIREANRLWGPSEDVVGEAANGSVTPLYVNVALL